MIPELRTEFNSKFTSSAYITLQELLAQRCSGPIQFRVAETPIFVTKPLLDEMADMGASMARYLIADSEYLAGAQLAIPPGYDVPA